MMTFFLDGAQVTPPINWQEVASTIKRDNNLNLFLLYQEYDLEFDADGYDYLIDKINNDSFCTQVTLDIYRDCGPNDQRLIFSGIMFISDCTVNERNCTIKCKVNDRSFFSKINNNKNIKTSLEGAYTKMKDPILAIQQYDLDVYQVVGNTFWKTIPACRIEEAFRYFIDFMTDNSIGFVSDTFGALGEWNGLCITTGERFRGVTPTSDEARWKQFSFIQLFTEVNKRIPIILLIEKPYTAPVVRIESIEYLNGNNINFIAGNIDEIETSFDTNKLYAIVKLGSPTDDTTVLNFPEGIDFYGFKDEEFHLLQTCNLDQTLDLTNDWVMSSNIMERLVTTGDQGFDSDIFLINSIYTDDFNGRTTNDNFLNVTPPRYHYNYLLNNENTSERYVEELASQIAAYYINSNEGQAYVYPAAVQSHLVLGTPEDWQNFLTLESYDYGNYYNTGTTRYVAPVAMNVTFKAQVGIFFSNTWGFSRPAIFMRFIVEHYDASNNLKTYYDIHTPNYFFSGIGWWGVGYLNQTQTRSVTKNVNLAAGDYLKMRIQSEPFSNNGPGGPITGDILYSVLSYPSETFFQVIDTSLTGGTFLNVDANQLKVQLHKFSYPMTQSEFDVILNDPTGRIGFNMNGQPLRYGWIKELKYNHTNSMAEFVLTTNKESQNAS